MVLREDATIEHIIMTALTRGKRLLTEKKRSNKRVVALSLNITMYYYTVQCLECKGITSMPVYNGVGLTVIDTIGH